MSQLPPQDAYTNCDTLISDDRFQQMWRMVGNTPIIKLCYRYNRKTSFIFVKCEQLNFTGSIKDRIALYILQQAYKKREIFPGDTIIEATSGNTGISFAAIGRALGHPVKIIMPDWLGQERRGIIRSMGAEIIAVSERESGFACSIRLAELLGKTEKCFLPRQFENVLNPEAHERTTGPEIWHQLVSNKIYPDAFVAGVGTGGTIMGIGRYLCSRDKDIRSFPIEPVESPVVSLGYKTGKHRIQGISGEFISSIVERGRLDTIIQVHDGDAIIMAQKLASQLGLGVGISSGANVIGAIKVKEAFGVSSCIVTIFPDCNKKYLNTDLFRKEPEEADYVAPYVEFIGYQPMDYLKEEKTAKKF